MQTAQQVCLSKRCDIVNLLLKIKQQASFIDRYTQFLAISITDRVLFKQTQKQPDDHQNNFNFEFAISALMLAYKFDEKHHFKLTQFLRFIELPPKYDIVQGKKRILKLQSIILQALDYQIPQITSYSMLRNSIKSQNQSEVRSEKQIYVKSVKILREGILQNKEFSLCQIVGEEIVKFVKNGKATARVRKIVKQLKARESCKENTLIVKVN